MDRVIRAVSLSFSNRPAVEIIPLVEAEAKKGCDIILLPEAWQGDNLETPETGAWAKLRSVAEKHGVYIIHPTFRKTEKHGRVNSAVLIGRQGETAGIYDKVYPYWSEFDLTPPGSPGENFSVFETDFGKIGMAICFDVNFPRLWEGFDEAGAEIVFWPSAYSAGASLTAHALNHNFYIYTSTQLSDCALYDITGKEIFYQKSGGVQICNIDIDLNRAVFHEDFNLERIEKFLAAHPNDIIKESHMEREHWIVLRGVNNASVHDLAAQFGLEELRTYRRRSRIEIDKLRGFAI